MYIQCLRSKKVLYIYPVLYVYPVKIQKIRFPPANPMKYLPKFQENTSQNFNERPPKILKTTFEKSGMKK